MNNLEKLEKVLDKNLYGKGSAKSWQALVQEVESEECKILWEDNIPIRQVSVLRIEVIAARECSNYSGMRLHEAYQEFIDGRRRERNLPGLSEKIKPDESINEAVIRAVHEELDIDTSLVSIQLNPCQETEEKYSPSYPGLLTRYSFRDATAILSVETVRPQYVEVQEDKKTVFEWRTA